MFKNSKAFSGFSVSDSAAAKDFYANTLGLDVSEDWMGLQLNVAGSNPIFIYQKDDHEPASFTVLNFPVDDIDMAVDELLQKGVTFEHYDMPGGQDEKAIMRGKAAGQGPDIAWFKDPSGNILSVLSN